MRLSSRIPVAVAGMAFLIVLLAVSTPTFPGSSPIPIKEPAPADAVWLYDDWQVEVHPTRGLLIDISRKARVESPRGRAVGRLKIWETFYQSLKKFSGKVTDTTGGILYQVEKDELAARFPFFDYRLYSNDRLYTVDLTAPTFPYLVEYHYRLQINNTFFWPDWIFPDAFPRERASYTVAVPHKFAYRTFPVRKDLQVQKSRTIKRNITSWSAENIIIDTLAYRRSGVYPVMYIAPEEFTVARRRGRTDSWAGLGRWYGDLTAGRRKLDKEQAAEVRSWVGEQQDPLLIAAQLKDIISRQWRYVAIEVGIGGWRPHRANSVFDNRYGDCKDLTFLWLAMLDLFDIPAYPALLRARNPQPLLPEFPKDWFDHVIGCAVVGTDTLWADLTAPGYPVNRLPYADEDRFVLVVEPDGGSGGGGEGGALRRTPSTTPEDNQLVRRLVGHLEENGDLRFSLRSRVSGHKLNIFARSGGVDNHFRQVAEVLGVLPGRLTVDHADFVLLAGEFAATVEAEGRINEWAQITPQRIIFPLAFAGWAAPQPLGKANDRFSPELRPYPCREVDSLYLILPAGYQPEFLPSAVELVEHQGSYAFSALYFADTLRYFRRFEYRADRAERAAGTDRSPGQLHRVVASLQQANAVFVLPDTTQAVEATKTESADQPIPD